MLALKGLLLLLCIWQIKTESDRRREKFLSLFSIVTFKNSHCSLSSDGSLTGTCMTSEDCRSQSGSADGNCAAGFGVCCSFILSGCGGTVNKNCTYIQNAGYPTGTSDTQTCAYTFARICPDICQIRLDFVNTVLTQPTATTGLCSTSGDSAVAVSPTGASPPSNLCGTLTGQHMYLESGASGNAGTFTISTSIATGNRSYRIKVTYVECSNLSKAPAGCVQYFTGSSGSFSSYNHQGGQQLANQDYNFCFRQEEGFCSYNVRQSATTNPDPFLLKGVAIQVDKDCFTATMQNYISFPISGIAINDYRCGGLLGLTDAGTIANTVTSTRVTPFQIHYHSEILDVATTGVNLDYTQLPC